MKVLHISNAYSGGGAENVFSTSLRLLGDSKAGSTHLSACCLPADDNSGFKPDLELVSWQQFDSIGRYRYFYNPENYRLLREFLMEQRPDIIHLHGFLAHLSASVIHAISSCRRVYQFSVVQTMHSHEMICANASAFDWNKGQACVDCMGKGFKGKIFYRNCDRRGLLHSWGKGVRNILDRNLLAHDQVIDQFVAPSHFVKQTLLKEGIAESSVSLIRNPVALGVKPPVEAKADEIVYFGRFSPEKNLTLLLKAFSILIRQHQFADYKLKLVGDGESYAEIVRTIQAEGLIQVVEIFPFQPQDRLNELIARAKVMVLPSNCLETYSLVIPEAISLDIMPVVSDLGAMREMINYLQCGYCFENEDVTSLSQAIQQALLNYNQSKHLLAEATRVIRTELSGVQYVKQLQTLYTMLSAGGAGRTLVNRSQDLPDIR